ncbi:MAG: hypothetical protein WKF71_10780 [Pyrinomonadaceae bacterium]
MKNLSRLNNRVLDRFTAEERKNIGIHTCPGGDCDATHSADVDYAELLPSMFKMNAGYFLIQLASETDKERVYKLLGEHSREDANGVPQVCFIGVTNPQNPRVETPEEVRDDFTASVKIHSRRTARLDRRLRLFAVLQSTLNRNTARPILPEMSRSKKSNLALKERRWHQKNSVLPKQIRKQR